jgi:hypothetical protein
MTAPADVGVELAALQDIQDSLASIAHRTDPERRFELVQLRKRLAKQIAVVGSACERLFATQADRQAEFRRLYSAMRSATALHQAEWPAVRLNEVDHLYRESASRAREANQIFASWLAAQLGPEPMREHAG